jgi:predicted DNA-binding ribbon-helix-helix protein
MTKGRSSTLVTVRLPDGVYKTLEAEAAKENFSVGVLIKNILVARYERIKQAGKE